MTFTDTSYTSSSEKGHANDGKGRAVVLKGPAERADDVVGILSSIVPNLAKILVEPDRVLAAATAISANVIGPAFKAKAFPDTVHKGVLQLIRELSRLPNNQKTWKKDVGDAFNDPRFFASNLTLVRSDWLSLLVQWTKNDKERMPEILSRITPPTTAGIVFGVGATSARLEADRRTQLNLRRIATIILASPTDAFVTELPTILEKVVELLNASSTSSPSSTTRAEVYMLIRALVLRTTPVHLAVAWPTVNAELHQAVASIVAPDHSASSDAYNNASVLQACKLLDLLIAVAPDDFQLHQWLFITDTVDAVYRPPDVAQPIALADELSEELGAGAIATAPNANPKQLPHHLAEASTSSSGSAWSVATGATSLAAAAAAAASVPATTSVHRTTLLGPQPGCISDDISLDRKDELVAKVLRPFFGQLSIFAFESTYAMGTLDWDGCVQSVLKDLFDERTIVRAL